MPVDVPTARRLRPASTPADGILEGPRLLRRCAEPTAPDELFGLRSLGR